MKSFAEIPEAERREIARLHIETLESWLRRLIHHQLSAANANYQSQLVQSEIADKINERISKEPHRYPRWIDATQLNEAIEIIKRHYDKKFAEPFKSLPKAGVVYMLEKVNKHRNPLSHGNTCDARALEQSVCYSNDVIEACKGYFMSINKQKQYDAPTFTRFTDSKGNVFHVSAPEGSQNIFDARKGPAGILHVGDIVTFEVEVDESYPPDSYTLHWQSFWGNQSASGDTFTIKVAMQNVSHQEEIRVTLVSNKEWHRSGVHDDFISVLYQVLPTP